MDLERIIQAMSQEARDMLLRATENEGQHLGPILTGFSEGTYEFNVAGRSVRAGASSEQAKDLMAAWGYLLVMGLIEATGPKQYRVTDQGYIAAARIDA